MRKYKLLSIFVITVILLFSLVFVNCDILGDDIETRRERARNAKYIPVTDITGAPTLITAGVPQTLSGNVVPGNATNKDIIFSVHEAGGTGAVITGGNVLTAPNAGTVTLRATITNGRTAAAPFIKDFSVTVSVRAEITVSQTVFTPVYVGYSQRDVQSVTISNIGTKAANVSGIALGGTNAASFGLSGNTGSQTIAAGGSAAVQVQPAGDLSAGTYYAAITVTYDEGRTAFNTVSFAVNPVSISSIGIDLVYIPSGTFTMGSPTSEANRDNGEIQHQVTISKGFYMGKYEVTQEQYQAVTGVNPSYFSSNPTSGEVQSRRPVEYVTWYDAVEFCNKLSEKESLTPVYTITGRTPTSGYPITNATVTVNWSASGYRLPTEAEWEYACRAGTTTAYNTGNNISDSTGWYSSNSNDKTHEVGKKPPNAYGLYDMHGNVWEWCWDWYGSYASEAQTDPTGAASGSYRMGRGGSWFSNGRYLRSADRNYYYPSHRYYDYGFRLVRS